MLRFALGFAAILSGATLVDAAWPHADTVPTDFKYFWLSGQLWGTGISPYGPELQALGEDVFPGYRINPFFYPPNWVIVSSLLAVTDPRTAATIWALISIGALMCASWQLAGLMDYHSSASNRGHRFILILFGTAVAAHFGTVSIHIGQPTPILLCAFTSLLTALRSRHQGILVAALIVLLLKPQFSLPLILAAFVFVPWMRRCILLAGCVTGVLTLIGLGLNNPHQTIAQFFANVSAYGMYPENWPLHMSGPNFLLALFGAFAFSAFVWLAVAMMGVLAAGALAQNRGWVFTGWITPLFFVGVAVWTLLVIPTHNSDLLLVMPVVLVWSQSGAAARVLLILGLFLIMRSPSLSVALGALAFDEKTVWVALLDTFGLFALALASLQALLSKASNTPHDASPGP